MPDNMAWPRGRFHGRRDRRESRKPVPSRGDSTLLLGRRPPAGRPWTDEKIATLCVLNAFFGSEQWNGRIDPFHHDHVADFACCGPAIVRGGADIS
jgi:hypothetical protein